MSAITSSFTNIVFVSIVIFALAQLFYYFKFKRQVELSDIDKALWQLRLFTIFLAALVFIGMLYLPSTGFYRDIDLSSSARETAFQDVMHNQQCIENQLDQVREVLYLVFLVLTFYLFAISSFAGRIWRERQRLVSGKSPALKKPL